MFFLNEPTRIRGSLECFLCAENGERVDPTRFIDMIKLNGVHLPELNTSLLSFGRSLTFKIWGSNFSDKAVRAGGRSGRAVICKGSSRFDERSVHDVTRSCPCSQN